MWCVPGGGVSGGAYIRFGSWARCPVGCPFLFTPNVLTLWQTLLVFLNKRRDVLCIHRIHCQAKSDPSLRCTLVTHVDVVPPLI
jgi:hypothetical protein